MRYLVELSVNSSDTNATVALNISEIETVVETHSFVFLDQVLRQPPHSPGWPLSKLQRTSFPQGLFYASFDTEMDPQIVDDPTYAPLMKNSLLSVPSIFLSFQAVDFLHDYFEVDRGSYIGYTGGVNFHDVVRIGSSSSIIVSVKRNLLMVIFQLAGIEVVYNDGYSESARGLSTSPPPCHFSIPSIR